MRSLAALVAVAALVVGACGGGDAGPDAPAVDGVETVCSASACVDYPSSWTVEVGETYLAFRHPSDPARVLASVGPVNMRQLVEAVGTSWPAPPRDAVVAFWSLIGGGGDDASLSSIETRDDGSIWSRGRLEGLHMWHTLVPELGRTGVGVEIRAPNDTWSEHAEIFQSTVRLIDGE